MRLNPAPLLYNVLMHISSRPGSNLFVPIALVILITAVDVAAPGRTAEARSPVQIKIKLAKNHYALAEPVAGSIIITSSIPATFPMEPHG
ncbi:MAG: hypothetical protein K8I00_12195 [Candidatus Omnitrophica bacterium]|nr:hypothetical protein [Candidatus Omnitrophota bacterium]